MDKQRPCGGNCSTVVDAPNGGNNATEEMENIKKAPGNTTESTTVIGTTVTDDDVTAMATSPFADAAVMMLSALMVMFY